MPGLLLGCAALGLPCRVAPWRRTRRPPCAGAVEVIAQQDQVLPARVALEFLAAAVGRAVELSVARQRVNNSICRANRSLAVVQLARQLEGRDAAVEGIGLGDWSRRLASGRRCPNKVSKAASSLAMGVLLRLRHSLITQVSPAARTRRQCAAVLVPGGLDAALAHGRRLRGRERRPWLDRRRCAAWRGPASTTNCCGTTAWAADAVLGRGG